MVNKVKITMMSFNINFENTQHYGVINTERKLLFVELNVRKDVLLGNKCSGDPTKRLSRTNKEL